MQTSTRNNRKIKAEMKKKEPMSGGEIRKTLLFILVFTSSLIYIVWRLLYTLPFKYGVISVIFGIILWLSESMTVLETFTHFQNARHVKIPEMPVIDDDMYPDVDVMIATHNESVELMYKTLNGCNYMKYPDKSKVHVILCDDKNRPEMAELARHMGAQYFGFDGNKHAKAGNLNYALPHTHSPLIAIFDADMIPTSDFLLETVPYFFMREMIKENGVWRKRRPDEVSDDKELGYVQTQQSFYNPDPLQRNLFLEKNAPNEQDYFYRAVNVARMNTGSAAFAGSNALFSRKALKEAGWFATHSITEDFATSIAILGKGYRSIALAKELAHGLCPEDVYSFIKQRQRWSRGAAQGILTSKFWKSGLPFKAMWNFLLSYFYWWTFPRRLLFIMCPILYGLFGVRFADVSLLHLMIVWLPYYIIYNSGLRFMSGGTTSSLWSNTVDTIQFPYMISPIVLGTLGVPQTKFEVTPKDRQTGRNSNIRLALPHMILAFLSLITAGVCIYQIVVYRIDAPAIVLFWTVYNLFTLLIAIVYYRGRSNNRYYERVAVPIPVRLSPDNRNLDGITADLSEGGMAILLDNPEYLPYEQSVAMTISYNGYHAAMKVRVLQVQHAAGKWKYSVQIADIEEKDRQEYLQIIYDREHLFPRTIDIGVTKEIRLILAGLRQKPQLGERKLPRIKMELSTLFDTAESGPVEIINFNYKYLLLKRAKNLPEALTITFAEGVRFKCRLASTVIGNTSGHGVLYEIEDWETLAVNPLFRRHLFKLIRISLEHDRQKAA